ncbi:hypothetical protein PRIPAC_81339 [Pristionchus pacificus]|uniref:Uncharacterized protein n=1 Tax=Pristionchus pacificus TaxID=54126 RepID=A0A2A6BXV8_PRIPA|nr:hypothetical protein PRIPAC_81339 [Pristionchus pacificus]|eukprot:PDM70718.1 hypothetical protein PRIPAC_44922 [Pristionchus pacificus]
MFSSLIFDAGDNIIRITATVTGDVQLLALAYDLWQFLSLSFKNGLPITIEVRNNGDNRYFPCLVAAPCQSVVEKTIFCAVLEACQHNINREQYSSIMMLFEDTMMDKTWSDHLKHHISGWWWVVIGLLSIDGAVLFVRLRR